MANALHDDFEFCPECEGDRVAVHDLTEGWLICRDCDCVFRVEDGVVELLEDE
jgi:uncharacterized protein YbaR (Trm112 family)